MQRYFRSDVCERLLPAGPFEKRLTRWKQKYLLGGSAGDIA